MSGWSLKWALLVLGTIALLVTLGLNIELINEGITPHPAHASESESEKPASVSEQPPTTLETLPCFACHAMGNYQEDGDFPHQTHAEEEIGHCHKCHAFSGHFQVTVREETCEECH